MSLKVINDMWDVKKKNIKISLEDSIIDKIKICCATEGMTYSNYMKMVLEYYWKRNKDR